MIANKHIILSRIYSRNIWMAWRLCVERDRLGLLTDGFAFWSLIFNQNDQHFAEWNWWHEIHEKHTKKAQWLFFPHNVLFTCFLLRFVPTSTLGVWFEFYSLKPCDLSHSDFSAMKTADDHVKTNETLDEGQNGQSKQLCCVTLLDSQWNSDCDDWCR